MADTDVAIRVFILLLLVASAVAMVTKWVRVPYTLALVMVGIVISPMHFLPQAHISPDLILLIFLPALLFEGAWNLKLEQLRINFVPIIGLALPGLLIAAGVLGAILHFAIGLPWAQAFLFGSMISATDPVSVLAIFRELGLPKRLTTIVEGESLCNDGTAVVVFRIILGLAVGASTMTPTQIFLGSVRDFGLVVLGGIALGAIVGLVASTLTSYFDDHLLEITLTTIAAYGSFLLAEGLRTSPVIAVLVTGLVIGNYGRHKGMSASTQMAVNAFWDYAAFVVNSLMFLLIGLEIHISVLAANWRAVSWAVAGMLAARAAAVYGLIPVSNQFSEKVPVRWRHVLFWGGLRGSLSIALALSLPAALPGREQLVAMVFGCVIFSLLFQGLSIAPLLRRLGLGEPLPEEQENEKLQGLILADAAAAAELDDMHHRGMVTDRLYEELQDRLSNSLRDYKTRLRELQISHHEIEEEEMDRVQGRLRSIKKTRLAELLRDGMLSEKTYRELSDQLKESATESEATHKA
jgi:Na+:H+ antiporter